MKIVIRGDGLALPIVILLPLSALKSRFLYNIMIRNVDGDLKSRVKDCYPIFGECISEIQKAVDEYGHFDLVNVTGSDGQMVLIRV